jgi:Arc/MetJ-type ribon-helix-helix transcriptional regulator
MSQLAKKTSISIPEKLLRKAKAKAKKDYRNNVSGYIQTLVEKDLQAEAAQ